MSSVSIILSIPCTMLTVRPNRYKSGTWK